MASLKPRSWTNKDGTETKKWVLRWFDSQGKRRTKNFELKRDAQAYLNNTVLGAIGGANRTVLQAAENYLDDFETLVNSKLRERKTYNMYHGHVHNHIAEASIAKVKLADLDGPTCKAFAEWLEANRGKTMRKRVWRTFKATLDRAVAIGWLNSNMAHSIKVRSTDHRGDKNDILEIAPKAQIKRLLEAAEKYDNSGFAAAFCHTLTFSALRMSELRGLKIPRVALSNAPKIQVRERANEAGEIGKCKSKAAIRDVPIGPAAVLAIKRWMLACPKGDDRLLFPNGIGRVATYANLWNRFWVPLMTSANLVRMVEDEAGAKRPVPLFGPHMLRHVGISLWIEDGATPKHIQTRAGHSSIKTTMDIYGHLWVDVIDEQAAAAASERSILG